MKLRLSPKRLRRFHFTALALGTTLMILVFGLHMEVGFDSLRPATAAPTPTKLSRPSQTIQSNTALQQQGRTHYTAAQYAKAVTAWSKAEKGFAAQGDTLNQALVLSNLALAHRQLGNWPEANANIQASLEALNTLTSLTSRGQRIYGQALNTQGNLLLAQGQAQKALASWEKSADFYTQANDTEGFVKSLINQSYALRSLGFFRESRDRLSQANEQITQETDIALKVSLKHNLGDTYRLVGDLETSETLLQESLALLESRENPSETATTYLSLGNTRQAKAQQIEALAERSDNSEPQNQAKETDQESKLQKQVKDTYQEALHDYDQLSNTAPLMLRVQAQLNQLEIHVHLGDWNAAQAVHTSLSNTLDHLPPGRPATFARIKLARLLMDNRSSAITRTLQVSDQHLLTLLKTARHEAQSLNDPIAESYALGYLGDLYETKEKYIDAKQLTQAALDRSQGQFSVAYQWQWQLGRIEDKLAHPALAIDHYETAFQNVQSVRNELLDVEADIRFNFRDRAEPLYREYISLLLSEANGADVQEALTKAQTVIDALRVAELEGFLACGLTQSNDEIVRKSLQDIASRDQKTGIIYPIILQDRLEVLLQRPGISEQSIEHYSVPLDTLIDSGNELPLKSQLKNFRQELEQPYFSTQRGAPPAERLYDWLIRPAEDKGWLESIDTLVFVLDGPFRNIPMAALYDSQAKAFLIEKYAISVTFGDLQLPEAPPQKDFRVLATGLSDDPVLRSNQPDTTLDEFGPLAYVQDELQGIKNKIDTTTLFLNQDFTREKVSTNMSSSDYNMVHLATHGEFGFTRDETFLLAAAHKTSKVPHQTSIEVEKIDLNSFDSLLKTRNQTPIELLVLSACETATGNDREVLGIAGLAIQSGARSTLATLWSISDLSTSVLMETFYEKLSTQGISKAQALQQAQIKLLKQGYKPSRWAPYLLLGDWR